MHPTSDPDERVDLELVLDELGLRDEFEELMQVHVSTSDVYKQWIINLYAEKNVRRGMWGEIVRQILLDCPSDVLDLVMERCRSVLRTLVATGPSLAGTHARLAPGVVFGRILSRARFREILAGALGGSSTAATDLISSLLNWDVSDWLDEWREYPLGEYVMWATFNEGPGLSDPFISLPRGREDIMCLLGMPWDDSEQLVFTYTLPLSEVPFVPTIIEAYAGGSWTVYFRPAHKGAPYGFSMPRSECGGGYTQPEVVHRPVTVAALNCSMEVL